MGEPSINAAAIEAVVDENGNAVIPAGRLPRPLPAGTHLRLRLERVDEARRPIEGVLPDLPELSWEAFEAASELAVEDTGARQHSA